MNLTEHDIAWIVAEVVRRLKQQNLDATFAERKATIPDSVITLETLRQHTGPSLTVTTKAIITPAARDELKKRGVKLVRGEVKTNTKQTPATLLAANFGADYQPKTLAQLAASYGATIEQHPATNLAAVIADHSERVVRQSQKALWFTSTPAHAVCLANRHAGVWAVQGFDEASLAESLKTTAANVLVINPKGKSQYHLSSMIRLFL